MFANRFAANKFPANNRIANRFAANRFAPLLTTKTFEVSPLQSKRSREHVFEILTVVHSVCMHALRSAVAKEKLDCIPFDNFWEWEEVEQRNNKWNSTFF